LTKERTLGSVEQFLGLQGLCEPDSSTKRTATLGDKVRLAQGTGSAHLLCIGWISIGALMASIYQVTRSSHCCDRTTRAMIAHAMIVWAMIDWAMIDWAMIDWAMIAWQDIFPPVRPRTVQRSIVVSCWQWQNRTV
jgi:hypothetical protein